MPAFINTHFLLHSPVAERLYFNYAQKCPIIDYHCHIDAKDIAQNISYRNLTQLWLSGDHYKWRLMRSAGVDERYITGDASDYEKFLAWAYVIESSIGHPLYHWTHLELLRYFDIKEPLTYANAESIWNITCQKLASDEFTARSLIRRSNVELICTTDDPVDDLSWHRMIADDLTFDTTVLPAFRPDRVVDIEKSDFTAYIQKLSEVCGIAINNLNDLQMALRMRLDFFGENGCRLADHGMERFVFNQNTIEQASQVFAARLANPSMMLSDADCCAYRSAMMVFFAKEYAARRWTMQIHFGCRRDNNAAALQKLGINTGYDTIAGGTFVTPMAQYLSLLTEQAALPRMILYSLDPNDDPLIDTLIGCFQDGSVPMKVQHGAAWWFNDNLNGIRNHLKSLASQSYLPGFVGMLTDSRCLLSYTRHEYFRRILCDYLGQLVADNEFNEDMDLLGSIVQRICYTNARQMFMDSEENNG